MGLLVVVRVFPLGTLILALLPVTKRRASECKLTTFPMISFFLALPNNALKSVQDYQG